MALTNKTIAATYKDLLHMDNGNSGLTSTRRVVKDGLGNSTGLYLGTNKSLFKPASNSTDAFQIHNAAGDTLFTVDTTNSLVKVGTGQVNPTTRYYEFVANDIQPTINTHMPISIGSDDSAEAALFGTGTDPATSYSTSNNAYLLTDKIWYLHDNVTIDAAKVFVASDHASNDTLRFHLMYFTIDANMNLSAGQVIGAGGDISNAGYELGYSQDLSIDTNNNSVTSGKVIMAFIRADSVNGDFYVNMNVKYHLT